MQLIKPATFETKKSLKEVETVYGIIDIFEEMLYEKGISIPDPERTGTEDEACIFGQTYYQLEDRLKEFLKERNML